MSANALPMFAIDVNGLPPGQAAMIGAGAIGHPVDSLSNLPAGDYYAQALLNIYTEHHRADGHTVWVHFDMDALPMALSSGNLYSDVQKVHLDPTSGFDVTLVLNR